MRLKRTLVILAITALTMGLLPMGSAFAGVSGVSVDTEGTPMWVKPISNDVQMMNINIATDATGATLVKLTVTYTGTDPADVSAVKLYDGGTMLQTQSITGGEAVFNVSKALAASSTTTLTVKADINSVPDGRVVQFRLNPGSVVLQTSGPAVAAYTSPDHGVTVDGTPPLSPSISSFPTVTIATVGAAPISGKAEVGSSVSVTITHAPGGRSVTFVTTANGSGAWSGTPNLSTLFDSNLTVTVTATDAAGNVSPTSTTTTLKDTVAPNPPAIGAIPPWVNQATQDSFFISGNAEAGARVDLTFTSSPGVTPVTGYTTAPGGNYAFSNQNLSSLPEGPITVTLTATDAALNKSLVTTKTVTKDTIANAPAVTTHNASASNYTAWTLTGTAEAGATVSYAVVNGATVSGMVVADGTGVYSVNLDLTPLADGNLTTTVSQIDLANNGSPNGTGAPAIKDIVAPAPPTIAAFANANFANMLAVPISGTAEVDATVTITVTGTSGSATATATAGGGNWSTTVNVSSVADGPMSATATATDAVGNVSVASTAYTTATKDAGVPAAPTALVFATVNNITKAAAPISGKAEAGSTVSVTVSDGTTTTSAVTATVNGSGDWAAMVDVTALTDGTITASVTAKDAAANVSVAATIDSVKDTVAPAAPADLTLHVPMYVNAATNLTAVTIYGDAGNVEAGAKVYVTLRVGLFSGFKMTTIANANGSWSKNVDVSSGGDKVMSVDIYQRDIAGNTSSTVTRIMTKDTMLPTVPTIDPLPTWVNSVNYEAVPVSGTAEADAKVTITFTDSANVPLSKSITASGAGIWSTTMDLSTGLAEGALTVTATAQDWAGNTGVAATAASTPIKDTIAPTGTYIDSFPFVSSHTAFAFEGAGHTDEPNANVNLRVTSSGGATMAYSATTADSDGYFRFVVNLTGLADGTVTVHVTARDAAGNAAAEVTLTVPKDTIAYVPAHVTHPTYVNATNHGSFTFSGTLVGTTGSVEPWAEVQIRFFDDWYYFYAIADANGNWSRTFDLSGYDDGPVLVSIRQIDAFGNQSDYYEAAIIKDTVKPTITAASVSYDGDDLYADYSSNRPADITATADDSVNWTWKITDQVGEVYSGTGGGANLSATWTPGQFAASGDYTLTISGTDGAGNPVTADTTKSIHVYNYDFRIASVRVLNTDQTTVATTVTAGTDYYVEVVVANLNPTAGTAQVVFQQRQGAVQAFTAGAADRIPANGTFTYTTLWKPTAGAKSLDVFVWNHLPAAGRQALSTSYSWTVTVQ